MKRKSIFKKVVSCALTTMMCFSGFGSVPTISRAADDGDRGTLANGYNYEMWNQNYAGNISYKFYDDGSFDCSFSQIDNVLFRTGKKLGSTKKYQDYGGIYIDYDVDYKPMGNSYMCCYGWTEEPTVEYYIVDGWGDWRPPNDKTSLGTVNVDGGVYDIYKTTRYNEPSIHGNETFDQYWSVRRDSLSKNNTNNHIETTISVSKHFEAWEKAGLKMGKMYEVALNVEGYRSSGEAKVHKNNLVFGEEPDVVPEKTVDPDANGNYFKSTFESGTDNWEGRGDAKVALDNNVKYDGNSALSVTNRTDNWHGAAIKLDTAAFKAGNTYSFSTGVLQKSGSDVEMKLTLQYTAGGKEIYDEVASATAKNGEWTKLENTSFQIPSGATGMVLYVEAPKSTIDFWIDNAQGSVEGTKASVATGGGEAGEVVTTASTEGGSQTTTTKSSGNIDVSDAGLKDYFSNYFKFGTAVSANEVRQHPDFILKHFNSITCENEMKPENILDKAAMQSSGSNTDVVINLSNDAKTILEFAEKNGIPVRGHTFVWYSQTPAWFFNENYSDNGNLVSKEVMEQRMENMIKNTFDTIKKNYPNLDLYAYDVANEAFKINGAGLRDAGENKWMAIYGDDSFLVSAFRYARKHAPAGCKLFYNDFNEYVGDKTNDIVNLAKKLKAENLIDGIGMQSHLDIGYPSASTYTQALKAFADLGLEVHITELDITTKGNYSAQADLYRDVVKAAMNTPAVTSLTVWGTNDGMSWRKESDPLLFDRSYSPKAAYDSITALVDKSLIGSTTANEEQPTTTTTTSTTPSNVVYGDADDNGSLTVADIVMVLQYAANKTKYPLDSKALVNCDVNFDNDVNAQDASLMLQADAGLITLPVGEKKTNNVDTTTTTTTRATTTTTTTSSNTISKANFFTSSFEPGEEGWTARGGVTLAYDSDNYYEGSKSIKVSGRTDTWQGIEYALDDSFVPGNAYSFSAAVLLASADDAKITLQYENGTGKTQYDTIASASAKAGEWTKLENVSYTIPEGATDLVVYIETADTTTNFYVDSAAIAAKGEKSAVVTGKGTVNLPAAPEIDTNKPMVAICFDDGAVGSAPTDTSMRIINAIADQEFHATFFYVSDWITGTSDENEVKYAYSKGMEIANHSASHPNLTEISANQVRAEYDNCAAKLRQIIGAEPSKLMRLPYLAENQTVRSTLYDVPLITCSIDTADWNKATKDQIVNKIKGAMNDGSLKNAIVLCHETYDSTASAIEELAPYLKDNGWQIVTVSEMFEANGKTLQGGQVYRSAN